ncbi:MAG: MFS transporter [Patescibacteria group bacterium]
MPVSHLHRLYILFPNKELNLFYFTVAASAFGDGIISIFVPIYLFQMGMPVHKIVFFYFLLFFYLSLITHFGAKIVERMGAKHSMLASAPFAVLYYLGFIYLPAHGWLFYILPLAMAVRATLYNFGYHFLIIPRLERKNEGRQISLMYALVTLAGIIGPVLGGVIATKFHFSVLYFIAAITYVAATLPLFLTKDIRFRDGISWKNTFNSIFARKNRGMTISSASYAIESILDSMLWPIYILLILGTVEKTGYFVSLSLAISFFVLFLIGRLTDKIKKPKLLKIGSLLYFFGWIGRLFVKNATGIFITDSYKNSAQKILMIPWVAYNYDLTTKHNFVGYMVYREFMYHFTRTLFLPFIILIFYFDFYPFTTCFIIAAAASLGYAKLNKLNTDAGR